MTTNPHIDQLAARVRVVAAADRSALEPITSEAVGTLRKYLSEHYSDEQIGAALLVAAAALEGLVLDGTLDGPGAMAALAVVGERLYYA